MKNVLISIKPKYVELIVSGKKTVEVRRTRPKCKTPFKVYIYCTQGKFADLGVIGNEIYQKRGKVIGEFVCDKIGTTGWFLTPDHPLWKDGYNKEYCLTDRELYEYSKGNTFYEWHISDLAIYDKPRELSEFYNLCDGYCFDSAKKHKCASFNPDNRYSCNNMKPLKRPPQSWCYIEPRQTAD